MTSRLLSLPRELRDIIWELCVHSPLTPPSAPLNTDSYIKQKPYHSFGRYIIHHSRADPSTTSAALLQVNHQVHSEVRLVLSRHPASATLDVLIPDEQHVYLTWLCLPLLAPRYAAVEVCLRFAAGSRDEPWTESVVGSTNTRSSQLELLLCDLFDSLCDGVRPASFVGARPMHVRPRSQHLRPRLRIEALVLEVLSASPPGTPGLEDAVSFLTVPSSSSSSSGHALIFANAIKDDIIPKIFEIADPDLPWLKYRFYGKISTFELRLDGHKQGQWDMKSLTRPLRLMYDAEVDDAVV